MASVRIVNEVRVVVAPLDAFEPSIGPAFDSSKCLCYFRARMLGPIRFAEREMMIFHMTASLLLMIVIAGCRGGSPNQTSQSGKAGAEAEAYKSKIRISRVGLAKGENYLGDEVFYVEGSLKNTGDRVVQRVEITFCFRDSLKQVVLKESRKALDYKGERGLEVDKSMRFQVAFDHLPKDWDYVVPELEVSQVTLK